MSFLETRNDVERTVGKGTTVRNDERYGREIRYPKVGLDIYAPGPRHREVAFAIATTSSRYRTADGVRVSSGLKQVAAIKGIECIDEHDCQHGNVHNKPGTAFGFRGGKLWRIVITILD